jgi:hypothetical protein
MDRSDEREVNERWSSWAVILCAAAILMITMGIRNTAGLFIAPINHATGLGIVAISLALAIGQFVLGARPAAVRRGSKFQCDATGGKCGNG